MDSTRVFVRGLPPNLTEASFKEHFGKDNIVTDAKLILHRRIGYIGYQTPEAAHKAVKYFNRSFIRMSRIGVEIARPINGQSHAEVPSYRPRDVNDEGASPRKKRRTEVATDREDDVKLARYLESMQPSSKSKTWENGVGLPISQQNEEHSKNDPEGNSEFPESNRNKPPTAQISDKSIASPTLAQSREPNAFSRSKSQREQDNEQSSEVLIIDATTANDVLRDHVPRDTEEESTVPVHMPSTDDDWLRSKTSRLLGLTEDDEQNDRIDCMLEDTDDENSKVEQKHPQLDETVDANATTEVHEIDRADETKRLQAVRATDEELVDTSVASIRENGRLFIRNLSYTTTDQDLVDHFSKFGRLSEAYILQDRNEKSKGFGYVSYPEVEDAVKAFQALDRKPFQGRLVHILPASTRRENTLDEAALSKLPLKAIYPKQSQSQFDVNSQVDAVMESVAERLGVPKSDIFDPTSSDAAVKQAHAETHVIQETKSYFAANGVNLAAFKEKPRNDRAILVKNFTFSTKAHEIKTMFEEFGEISRFLLPPSGTIAIVEFAQASGAKSAFAHLAYRKLKESILFLEKAPRNIFVSPNVEVQDKMDAGRRTSNGGKESLASATDLNQTIDVRNEQLDTATLYVRNLSFSTTQERFVEAFSSLEGFLSATVKTKKDPKRSEQSLSMGYGFLEFRTKLQAQAALNALDGFVLDGHRLVLRASHRGVDAADERRREDRLKKIESLKTKIIIKNLPFEANKKDVRGLFKEYGQLRSVRVPKKFDSTARGFAFADFVSSREAENAMDALRDTHLLGRKLVLEFASGDAMDPEEEIEKMQEKVTSQANKVAIQNLTNSSRKKLNIEGMNEMDEI